MVVLNVRANIGYYTLLFSKLVGQGGQVFSFEPVPELKNYLDKNITANKLKNVRSFGFALFDRDGCEYMEDPLIGATISPLKKTPAKNDILVEMRVFDSLKKEENIGSVERWDYR